MRWIPAKIAIAAWIVCASFAAGAGEALTYVDFIKQLADLERLATLPAAGESCAQWSSYDRASVYDAASGKYVAWDANGDGGGFIREENGQAVMAEMEGPGCIQRIWSAAPGDGHVRIYLDGAAEPAVDLPFMGYFDGKNAPFNRNAICYTAAKGWDCFVPIPYQKSCKIVADKNWGNYFHFTYRTFPKDMQVPTFRRDLTPEENAALDAANKILGACGPDPAGKRPDAKTSRNVISLKAGSSTPTTLEGPAVITTLRLKIDPPDDKSLRERLRQWTIQIAWDDDTKPAVWAPIADFFGTAPGPNAYRSLPLGLTEDGWWYCNWYMPFAKKAVITIANESSVDATFSLETTTAPLTKPPEELGRFHAKWHLDAFLPAEPERAIDWTMLKTEGRGRFCGVMLHIWNPRGGWWGEGDEKFFVDHEKFPSTIGTGSEDYFGYAWGNPELFQRPYHNQTISMNNQGHISVNRWHIVDNVPFQRAFEGDIEKYFPNAKPTRCDCIAFWYLAPGVTDAYEPVPVAQRTDWPQAKAKRVPGALEGEKLRVLSLSGGTVQEQDMGGFGDDWSDDRQLWWTGAKPGDKLELALPVEKDGDYKLEIQFAKARDYGIVQLQLDGRKLGDPIDLYDPTVDASGPMDFGVQHLTKGEHKLIIEITGANPSAVPSHMVGLDYVKID